MLRHASLIPLSHEHQHALALCVEVRRAMAGDASKSAVSAIAQRISDQFDSEICGHFDSEERVLFPQLSALPETSALVGELMGEHRRLTALVDRLRTAPAAELVLEFAEMLSGHVRKEENILFQETQRLLSPEQLSTLGQELAAAQRPPSCKR